MAKKTKLDWEQVMEACSLIAHKIKESEIKFDHVISIGRGGFVPARIIAEQLNVRRVHNIGIDFYTKDNKKKKKPTVYQEIDIKFKSTDNILLIDDIYDTGETIEKTQELVREANGTWIFTAVLCSKHKLDNTFFAGITVDPKKWVVFPWE